MVNNFSLKDYSMSVISTSIDEELASLTIAALNEVNNRPSFADFKKFYYKILRKLSTNYEIDVSLAPKRQESFRNSNIRYSLKSQNVLRNRNRDENKINRMETA